MVTIPTMPSTGPGTGWVQTHTFLDCNQLSTFSNEFIHSQPGNQPLRRWSRRAAGGKLGFFKACSDCSMENRARVGTCGVVRGCCPSPDRWAEQAESKYSLERGWQEVRMAQTPAWVKIFPTCRKSVETHGP
jgi:hypothetical protein